VNGAAFTYSNTNYRAHAIAPAADRPDYLAGALLQSLMRPMIEPFAPRLLRTWLFAFVSFGIIPLIQMPRKFRSFAARERDQLFHLASWMRLQFGSDADSLDPRTASLDRFFYGLRLLSWAGALSAFGVVIWYLSTGRDLEDLGRATYGFFGLHHHRWAEQVLFSIWMISLCVGYSAQWMAVQVHQARVRTFIARFNALAMKQNMRKLAPPPEALGLRPMWLLGAVGFMCMGTLWGIPLMLAGAAQTRYIKHRSRWTRGELAQRVREVLRTTRPTMMLAVPVALRRKCPVAVCQAPLPQVATFCPRCGTRVAAVDRVA
jgi:hypothetical protein